MILLSKPLTATMLSLCPQLWDIKQRFTTVMSSLTPDLQHQGGTPQSLSLIGRAHLLGAEGCRERNKR